MMSKAEVVARLDGIGHLERDGRVALSPVRYQLVVIQRILAGDAGETLETDGSLIVRPGEIPDALVGEPIELITDDGRRLPCYIKSVDGTLVLTGQ